jgi:GntR family transcriptional regulator
MVKEPDPADIKLDVRPLHLRVEEVMESLLKGYSPGDQIPSEAKLAKLMNVSRNTVREVLRALEERGRVIRRHGKGTFITHERPVLESGLEVLESLDKSALRLGESCYTRDLIIKQEKADSTMAQKLKVDVNSPVTVVTRTRVISDKVVAYMYDVIPASIATPEEIRSDFSGSMLDYFQQRGNPYPYYAITRMLSIQADKDLARHLQVSLGTALLLLEESLYSDGERLINYSHNYYNTSHFVYHIVRHSLRSVPIVGGKI